MMTTEAIVVSSEDCLLTVYSNAYTVSLTGVHTRLGKRMYCPLYIIKSMSTEVCYSDDYNSFCRLTHGTW
jgi:guanyl-specific ribonuclease Sa